MTLHGGGITPALGASHDMKPQRQQWQEDKNSRPGDFSRADTEQHHDCEADHPRIQPRPPERTRRHCGRDARRLAAAAIETAIQPLENCDAYRRDEIPSEVVADWDAEMRSRRVVPENLA